MLSSISPIMPWLTHRVLSRQASSDRGFPQPHTLSLVHSTIVFFFVDSRVRRGKSFSRYFCLIPPWHNDLAFFDHLSSLKLDTCRPSSLQACPVFAFIILVAVVWSLKSSAFLR